MTKKMGCPNILAVSFQDAFGIFVGRLLTKYAASAPVFRH